MSPVEVHIATPDLKFKQDTAPRGKASCFISYAIKNWRFAYRYARIEIPTRKDGNQTVPFRYRRIGADGSIIRLANCTVPDDPAAIQLLVNRFQLKSALAGNYVQDECEAVTAATDVVSSDCEELPPPLYNYCAMYPADPDCMPYEDGDGDGCDPSWEECGGGGGGGDSGGDTPCETCGWEPFPNLPPWPNWDDDYDGVPDAIPNCNSPVGAMERAWCKGYTPQNIPYFPALDRVTAALDRIAARGPVCSELAAFGRVLLGRGHLRLFDGDTFDFGNDDRFGGGTRLGEAWIVLEENWVRFWHDQIGDGMNLDAALAHELDHTKGRRHLTNPDGTENPKHTPNTVACGGV